MEEVVANINEARKLWIETVYKAGREIPSLNVGSNTPSLP